MKKINTNQPYSPHLKEIMAEIIAVLKKHDVAAHVLLQEHEFSEYLMSIDTSWSLLRFDQGGIRIRSKLVEDFAGDKDAQKQASINTAGMVRQFADILARDAKIFEDIHAMLDKNWNIIHTPGIYTPYRKQ